MNIFITIECTKIMIRVVVIFYFFIGYVFKTSIGIKSERAGIITAKNRFVVEIMSSEKIETIVKKEDKILIDDDYLRILIDEANSKLKKTREKISNFELEMKKIK